MGVPEGTEHVGTALVEVRSELLVADTTAQPVVAIRQRPPSKPVGVAWGAPYGNGPAKRSNWPTPL